MPILIIATVAVLTNAIDVASAVIAGRAGDSFDLTGQMTFVCSPRCFTMALEDRSGAVSLRNESPDVRNSHFTAGERVHVTGRIETSRNNGTVANCYRVRALGRPSSVPRPTPLTIREIGTGRFDNRVVQLRGNVREVFRDEIDPDWIYLTVRSGPDSVWVTAPTGSNDEEPLKHLTDADIEFSGVCLPILLGTRRRIGRIIQLQGLEDVRITRAAPADPFSVPEVPTSGLIDPVDILNLGRRSMTGRVLAAWHGNRLLIRDSSGNVHNIELASGPLPACGDGITVAGLPETDLYRINLSSAVWKPNRGVPLLPDAVPTDATPAQIMADERGRRMFKSTYHGQAVRLRGTVQSMPSSSVPFDTLVLRSGDFTLPVSVDALGEVPDGLCAGCEISVVGICFVQTENWRPHSAFPHTNGITLIVRQAGDIRILSRPPWWTPVRLLAVIAVLLLTLAVILLWNRFLRHVAERRGHELFRENVARISANLRRDERTRLAIELHDSIAQSLAGVSMQIDAGNHDIASKTLKACRQELRDCLWDLRNQTLEETDIDEAIRRTIRPHIGDALLTVRFNVPRSKLSDTAAHALLRVIRELSINAVRHGHACSIKVAGEFHDGLLRFSVRDDGTGFDPDHVPGVNEGHFGLQGIRERIDPFNGIMTIASAPGRGTKVSITMSKPK